MREVIVTAGGLSEPIDSVRSITNTSTGALGAMVADEFARNSDHVTFVCPKNSSTPQLVPDLQIRYVTTARNALETSIDSGRKIPSSAKAPVIRLKPTPKLIAQIKALQPETRLIGFKLLSQVSLEELFETAGRLGEVNRCDFVVANRLEDITPDAHLAYFVDEAGSELAGKSKEDVAKAIVQRSAQWK